MKMLPILVLIVLCGILAQNVQGQSFSQISVNISPERFQQMITARMDKQAWKSQLQNLPLQEGLKGSMGQGGGAKGFLGIIDVFGGMVNNVMSNILGLQIKKVEMLKIDLRFDDIEKKIFVIFPAYLEVQLKMPLNMGNLVHFKISLDLQAGVLLQKDPRTGNMRLVLGNCHNNPGQLRITLLNNNQPLFKAMNDILQSVTSIFEKIIPDLLQKQICPLANGLLQIVLNLLQNTNVCLQATELMLLTQDVWLRLRTTDHHPARTAEAGPVPKAGQPIQLVANSFDISGGSMRIDYQGSIQANGGGSYVIPPSSNPLPSVPLGGASMNMVMGSQLISAIFQSELPAQTITIESGPQVAVFEGQLAAIRGFSLPAGVRIQTLQMSYGSPAIHLNSGKINVLQDFQIKVLGSRHGATQLLLSIAGKISSVASVSVTSGKMTFTLALERLNSLSLEQSFVGNLQVRHIYDTVFQLMNTMMIPQQNRFLSAHSYPLPMIEGFEGEQFQVAAAKDSLVVYTGGEQQVQYVQQVQQVQQVQPVQQVQQQQQQQQLEQQVQTTETTWEWVTWEEIPAEP